MSDAQTAPTAVQAAAASDGNAGGLSCSIAIRNALTGASLFYVGNSCGSNGARWQNSTFPAEIPPGQTSPQYVLLPPDAKHGSAGTIVYAIGSAAGPQITFTFQCPKDQDDHPNQASYTASPALLPYAVPYASSVGGGATRYNSCDKKGGPLSVNFEVCYRLLGLTLPLPASEPASSFPVLGCDGAALNGVLYAPGGSTEPGLLCGSPVKGMYVFDAEVTTDCHTPGSYKLVGRSASQAVEFKSAGKTRPTGNTSTATPIEISSLDGQPLILGLNETISWDFGDKDEVIADTPLELYWTVKTPCGPWGTGVWIQCLRDLYATVDAGVTDQLTLQQQVVQACFSGFKVSGACGQRSNPQQYNGNGAQYVDQGIFYLWGWYQNKSFRTGNFTPGGNCADQQALVAVMFGALGLEANLANCSFTTTPVSQLFNDPNTLLLGGQTVAAFHAANPSYTWSEHFFVTDPTTQCVFDATFGPELGTRTVDAFYAFYFAVTPTQTSVEPDLLQAVNVTSAQAG